MQPLKFFIGYMPKVDRLPPEPKKLGLAYRFAFVLESYRPGCVDDFFDAALYKGLVNIVSKVAGGDKIRVVISPRETRDVSTAEEFHRLLEEVPDAEREPFPRVLLLRRSSVVAVIESEPWAHVGGPEPYHDSYTLAVFSASDVSERLMEEARSFCKEVGAEITDVVRGEDQPIKPGFLDRVKNFLGWH